MTSSVPASPHHGRLAPLPALTGIRFFAAIYVVGYHFVGPHVAVNSPPLRHLMGHGYSAVSFFLILSGFVLSYSYAQPGAPSIDRGSFWVARISRIYPAYLLAFLIAAPFQVLGSVAVNGVAAAAGKLAVGAAACLLLVQAWTPWTAWYWNIPAWSLSVEAFLYLCFPFLIGWATRRTSSGVIGWLTVSWVGALLFPLAYSLSSTVSGRPPLPTAQLAIETNPALHLPQFLIGVFTGVLFTHARRLSRTRATALSLVALGALIVALAGLPPAARTLIANGLLAPLSATLIFALAHGAGPLAAILSVRPLLALGEASYALYILQYPMASIFALETHSFSWARFTAYVVTLIVASLLTFYYIETPARRWMRRALPFGR